MAPMALTAPMAPVDTGGARTTSDRGRRVEEAERLLFCREEGAVPLLAGVLDDAPTDASAS